jgi:hypothetical protein
MTLKTKKTTVFAAKETTYGTAVVLTGAKAIRTHGAKITPFAATEIKRDLDAQGFGSTGTIHAGAHAMLEFDVEMAGSGAAGTRPAYGDLFLACAMSETIVAVTSVTYAPASGSTDSLTMYFELDGQRHALIGSRGTWSIKADSQGIPYLHFVFTGMWVDPLTITSLVPNFAGFITPRPIAFDYTPKISLHALASVYKSFGFDYGNQVEFIDNPGEQSVEIVDRRCAGNVSLLAPILSTKNYFTVAKADTTGALSMVHGMTAGNIVTLAAPVAQILNPAYGTDKGRATIDAKLDIIITTADDEMTLAFT